MRNGPKLLVIAKATQTLTFSAPAITSSFGTTSSWPWLAEIVPVAPFALQSGVGALLVLGIVFFDLLIPDQTVTVRSETGDHVVQAVTIHVIDIHLSATVRVRVERELVVIPNRIAGERLRLLPPAVLFQ